MTAPPPSYSKSHSCYPSEITERVLLFKLISQVRMLLMHVVMMHTQALALSLASSV